MNTDTLKATCLHLVEEDMSARRLVESTRSTIRLTLHQFFRWASQRGTPDIRIFGKKDLVAYQTWLCRQVSQKTGKPLAPTTINRRFDIVYNLYACLYRSALITENPCDNLKLKLPTPHAWKRRPLTRAEIERFLESIDTTEGVGLRDRCLYELMYSSGLRVNEATCLKVGNIDFDQRVMVVRGKFDKDRMVPFSEVAHSFLVLYLGERIETREAWVFPGGSFRTRARHMVKANINIRFKKRLKGLHMDKPELCAHSIRHSTATHLLENGASVRHVQELLGHANVESTARYTQVMTDNLAKVYRKYHPREHDLFEVV